MGDSMRFGRKQEQAKAVYEEAKKENSSVGWDYIDALNKERTTYQAYKDMLNRPITNDYLYFTGDSLKFTTDTNDNVQFKDWYEDPRSNSIEWKGMFSTGPELTIGIGSTTILDVTFRTLVAHLRGQKKEVVWFDGEPVADVLERLAVALR